MHSFFPLFSYRPPQEVWETEPTYLFGEISLLLLTLVLVALVARTGRSYLFVCLASFTGGALIELLTIMEPQIGNFYHSQASLMLFGKREPAYMLFSSIVLPWAAKLNALEDACFAALLSTYLFGILDAVGLKFLWWTWHNSEFIYQDRTMGVPIASAFWIMASTLALSFVIHKFVQSKWFKQANIVVLSLVAMVAGPIATVVIMNIPFLLFYHPLVTFLGYHASLPLFLMRFLCTVVVVRALWVRKRKFSPDAVFYMAVVYVAVFLLVVLLGTPEAVRRTSYGQPFGSCEATEPCFWGAFNRSQYVCPEAANVERDQYSLDCLENMPTYGSNWYTVCGVPFYPTWWRDIVWYFGGGFCLLLLSQLRPVHAKTN